MKELFNAVTEDDVMRVTQTGALYIGEKRVPDDIKNSIITGAQAILAEETWKLLTREMQYVANKHMFNESQEVDDIVFAKAVLYTIDVMNKKLYSISKIKPSQLEDPGFIKT